MAEETAKQEEVKEETATPAEETKEGPAKFKSLVDQISELSVLDRCSSSYCCWRSCRRRRRCCRS